MQLLNTLTSFNTSETAMPFTIQKTDAEWQAILQARGAEPVAYQVTRHAATERKRRRKELGIVVGGSYA